MAIIIPKRSKVNDPNYNKFSLSDLGDKLDNVVGEDGVKTDVRITLAEKDYYSIFAVFALGMTLGAVGQYFVHKLLDKMFK